MEDISSTVINEIRIVYIHILSRYRIRTYTVLFKVNIESVLYHEDD